MSRDKVFETVRGQHRTWLVTGAAGFIGSHLVEALLKLDQSVVALDNYSTGRRENLAQVREAVGAARAASLRMIEGDIRDFETCVAACRGVDVVLHEAAIGSVPRSMEDPLATNATNIDGFLNMLTAARDTGVKRFVYAASSSTYGDARRLPFVEAEIGKPLSPYALTKYVDELYAGVFARCFGVQTVGLRYFNVFGPRQDPEGAYAAVIPKWIAALIHNQEAWINGDGTTARDFCYVDNVVQANLLAATTDDPAAVNEVYNVAFGAQTTLEELFQMIRLLLAAYDPAIMARRPVHRDFRPGDMHISQADIGKAQTLLRYDPAWDVREGMKWTVDAYVDALSSPSGMQPIRLPGAVRDAAPEVQS